jgi:putative polyhydroxyalkanoate system protein
VVAAIGTAHPVFAERGGRGFGYTSPSSGGPVMATMAIAKKHHLSHKQAKAAAQKVADDLKERFDLSYTWRGDSIEFERPGLAGKMHVGRSEVRLACELGLMLSLLKPKLESAIHSEFDKRFGKSA